MKNTTEMFCQGSSCAIDGMGIDPMEVQGTIAAGTVGKDTYTGPMLAKIDFPNQIYRAGFCPEAAHCHGTLFPELVRLYE